MGLGVATNVVAMTASRHLAGADRGVRTSLERLSSGYRINRAADDAAALAVSEGLRSQVGGMTQGLRNARDAVNLVQVADAALGSSTAILQRMRDLAVQAANTGVLDGDATIAVQAEIAELKSELTRIAEATTFNGIPLLDGTYRGVFQLSERAADTIEVVIDGAAHVVGLGLSGVDVTRLGAQAVRTSPARGPGDDPRAGLLVFVGATGRPDGINALTGTITLGGATIDLDALTDTDGDGVVGNREAVDQLNAAAQAAGLTHRPDPFLDDGDDLVLRGPVPATTATPAELADASPVFSGSPDPTVRVVEARTGDPAAAGEIAFPGFTAAAVPALRGSITANGRTLDLSAVAYTDTDGDGTVDGDEALAQLNAAALAAGITTAADAFQEVRPVRLDEDGHDVGAVAVVFRGPVPADGASAADLAAATPVYAQPPVPIAAIDAAITAVSSRRASLGAVQNRLEHVVGHLGVAIENATAAVARIRDTDMAAESTRLARVQVLVQAGAAMLAQANQSPRHVLALLN